MANSLPAQFILPFLLLLGSCSANLIRGGHMLMKPKKEFDYFTLSLSWSGTKCLNVKECCDTNGCCRSDVATRFTIRAFWPDFDDGTWPTCCKGSPYNENELSIIKEDLNKYWPSYYCTLSSACGSAKGSNWAYEWVKHGTCASPVLTNQYEYFSTAMMLYFKYNITEVLVKSGYEPSNSAKYPLDDITSSFQNALKITPIVTCYGDSVKEVQICFDKSLQLQECPSTASTCPSLVTLPIKNVTLPVEKMNFLSLNTVLNW